MNEKGTGNAIETEIVIEANGKGVSEKEAWKRIVIGTKRIETEKENAEGKEAIVGAGVNKGDYSICECFSTMRIPY